MTPRIFEALDGELLLDNERVVVQRLVLAPGQATGRPLHDGRNLQVFVHGGMLRDVATGRRALWRDGRVMWRCGPPDPRDAGHVNDGETPIDMVWVAIKPAAPDRRGGDAAIPEHAYLNYPNVPGEDLLENEHVIVQRFVVPAGQWEGVHAHHPDMLYIHIRGGQWGARSYGEPAHVDGEPVEDGYVGWMPTIGIDVGHEAGNLGDAPIDLVWVTFKR